MIAPVPQNNDIGQGSFGQPLQQTTGSIWTADEFRGLQRMAGFDPIDLAIRKLIGTEKLEQIALSGRSRAAAADN